MEALDKQFGVTDAGSTVEAEVRAGITTFLTMAYILMVNPAMLSGTGIGFEEALFATAIAAFIGCTVMGLWANLPFALAPGMGLNAYFTFAVVGAMGIAWEVALAAVLVEGIIFLIISLPQVGWRTKMINSIPTDLKIATGAGIGMFLAMIGLEETGLVVNNGVTLVDLGAHAAWEYNSGELISIVGLIAITGMMARGMKGAIIYGIIGMAIYGWAVGATDPYNMLGNTDGVFEYNNEAIMATPHYFCNDGAGPCVYEDTTVTVYVNAAAGWGAATAAAPAVGDLITTDALTATGAVGAALSALGDVGGDVPLGEFLLVMITFLFVDIFDTAGTLYSVGRAAGYVDENDELKNSNEAFMSDAAATIVGANVWYKHHHHLHRIRSRSRRGWKDRPYCSHRWCSDAIRPIPIRPIQGHTTVRDGNSLDCGWSLDDETSRRHRLGRFGDSSTSIPDDDTDAIHFLDS